MNRDRPGIAAPVLIGGVAAGILSGVPIISCMCCLWVIGGGILSVFLLAKDSPFSLSPGDGAVVGAFSGTTAAVVSSLIDIPLKNVNVEILKSIIGRLAEFTEDVPADLETLLEQSMQMSLSMFLFGLFVSAVISAGLGALGGILGVSFFGKQPSPPDTASDAS